MKIYYLGTFFKIIGISALLSLSANSFASGHHGKAVYQGGYYVGKVFYKNNSRDYRRGHNIRYNRHSYNKRYYKPRYRSRPTYYKNRRYGYTSKYHRNRSYRYH